MTDSGYGQLYDDLEYRGHLGDDPAQWQDRRREENAELRSLADYALLSSTTDPLPELTDDVIAERVSRGI